MEKTSKSYKNLAKKQLSPNRLIVSKKQTKSSKNLVNGSNTSNLANKTKPDLKLNLSHKLSPVSKLNSKVSPGVSPRVTRNIIYPTSRVNRQGLVSPTQASRKINFKYTSTPSSPKSPRGIEVKFPITPAEAISRFSSQLTDYEQGEITDYSDVYYMGNISRKIRVSSREGNLGYDDDQGNYKVIKSDHIAYRYEIISLIGRGSFGQVCKAFDHKRKEMVALKIIKNKKKIMYQAGVEISVLCKLRELEEDSKYVVQLKNYFLFRKHVCLVFELLNVDLYDFMKKNQFRGCSLKLIKRFAYQILTCLRVLKTKNIIHCDLKPENILLCNSSKSQIKLIDFGSSCFTEEQLYTYIQSRFYRAPEIMLGIRYTHAIDMWSFGCILAELYTGIPLFPGETETQQMLRIMELTGPPPAHILERSTRKHHFFDQEGKPKLVPNKKGIVRFPGTKKLSTLIGCADEDFLDLVSKCLDWDPETRLKPSEALGHRFIAVI